MRALTLVSIMLAAAACSVPPDKILAGDGGVDASGGGPPPDGQPGVDPDTTITQKPSASDNSTIAAFAFTSDLAGATFECALDHAGFASCPTPKSYGGLLAGAHHFEVRAVANGRRDPSPASWDWSIDLSTPDTVIDSRPPDPSGSKTAMITFHAVNAGTSPSFTCALDGASASCASPLTYGNLTERQHTLTITVSGNGKTDPTPATVTWTVDLTPPITTVDTAPTGTVADATSTFWFHSETGATFACAIDTGAWSGCASPHTVGPLPDGPHTFSVRATDAAGNVEATAVTRTWSIDTTAPTATITSGPPPYTSTTTATFGFTSEAGATFSCQLDSGAVTGCGSPVTTPALLDGPHTFSVWAADTAGNLQATATTASWTIDTVAPTTTIATKPGALSASTSAAFTFSSNEPGATFECNLDGGGYAACPASDTITGLGQGTHQLYVRAVDRAGNRDPSPPQWSWSVDTVAPTTTITSGPSATTYSGVTTFTFTANEGTATFECALDNAAFASCNSPYTTWIGNGAHAMHVRATDGAGNVGAAKSWSWTTTLANLMFVTYTNSATGTHLGGLAGADNICATQAQAAGLKGTYRAWLSTSTVNAIDRLGSARGWVRVDGKPFVDTQADLAAGHVLYPPVLDASGNRTEYSGVLTGTDPDGHYAAAGGSCLDWTSTDPSKTYQGGESAWGSGYWTRSIQGTCNNYQAVIYCLGVDYQTAVAPPAATVRHVFLSAGAWTPGGGLAGADAACASEASAAGLAGTYKAALPTASAGVLARFSSTGAPWARVDGVLITATAAALFDPQLTQLDAPVDVTAAGQYVDGWNAPFTQNLWTGPRLSGSANTCASWTSSSSSDRGDVGSVATTPDAWVFADNAGSQCNTGLHLLCMQQ